MKLRIIILLIIGVVIIGGAMASTSIKIGCKYCSGDGKIECKNCDSLGAVVEDIYWVDCTIKGIDPFEEEKGYYQYLIGVCPECEGVGASICPRCNGIGILRINEILLSYLRIKK